MKSHSTADVTVVISTFNRANFLPEAIESMLAQSVRPARIVVVDDGSTDETPQIVEQYSTTVDYIRKKNGGKSRALNYVLPSIKTEYIWFFDDDDAAYPYALEHLLSVLEKSPGLGFAFGSCDLAKSDINLLSTSTRPVPYLYANEPIALQRLKLYHDCTISMSGSLIRTDAIRAVNGLNEKLIRSQDYDLLLRLAAKFDFAYCGSSVFVVRQHGGLRGSSNTQHPAVDRDKSFAKYNELIGRYLRYELPLKVFSLEPSSVTREQRNTRNALINRAWALGPKSPTALAISDLIEAFDVEPSRSLDNLELKILEETLSHDFVAYRPTRTLLRLWHLAKSYTGCSALGHLSKGIYRLGRKQNDLVDQTKLTSVAILLFGVSKLGKVVRFFSTRAHLSKNREKRT